MPITLKLFKKDQKKKKRKKERKKERKRYKKKPFIVASVSLNLTNILTA